MNNMRLLFFIPMISALKLCIDCKHYKNNGFHDTKYGKCTLFPIEDDDYYLVNGESFKQNNHYYCSTARYSSLMCGKEGKYFN